MVSAYRKMFQKSNQVGETRMISTCHQKRLKGQYSAILWNLPLCVWHIFLIPNPTNQYPNKKRGRLQGQWTFGLNIDTLGQFISRSRMFDKENVMEGSVNGLIIIWLQDTYGQKKHQYPACACKIKCLKIASWQLHICILG